MALFQPAVLPSLISSVSAPLTSGSPEGARKPTQAPLRLRPVYLHRERAADRSGGQESPRCLEAVAGGQEVAGSNPASPTRTSTFLGGGSGCQVGCQALPSLRCLSPGSA